METDQLEQFCHSLVNSITVDDLMNDRTKPSIFTMLENLIIRKYKLMVYEQTRNTKKRQQRHLEGCRPYTINEEIKPEKQSIINTVEALKIKYAVLKGIITKDQALKYFDCYLETIEEE